MLVILVHKIRPQNFETNTINFMNKVISTKELGKPSLKS